MRISLPSFAAGALAATLLVAVPSSALNGTARQAANPHPKAYDGTAPAFAVSRPSFIIGRSIDAAAPPGANCPDVSSNFVPLRWAWSGSDPISGIAGYDVWVIGPQHIPPDKLVDQTQAKHFDFEGTNYDGDCGGGTEFEVNYWVVARDNRANTAASGQVTGYLKAWQENGVDATGAQPAVPLTRSGWAGATCTCYNNGRLLYSTLRGARLTYRVTTTNVGQVVGVVVDKNTNRGRLGISVDGGPTTTVATYASSPKHRVIVWQKPLSMGTHTLALTNMGSPSHPRVAIDSILLTNGPNGNPAPDPAGGP